MYYSVSQLRQMETAALAIDLPLMQRAGEHAADFITARFGKAAHIVALAGPGNNGGDAFVAATLLRARGFRVDLVCLSDPLRLPDDAALACTNWLAAGGEILPALPAVPATVFIDGLFGLGLNRPMPTDIQALICQINLLGKPVLALDVPSGIDADSGHAWGEPLAARWTLSFIGTARGLLTGAACDVVGERHLATLDFPAALATPGEISSCGEIARHTMIRRANNSHKGRFGTLLVVGGTAGMVGASLLAGRAALHAGAGKVMLAMLDTACPRVDPCRPELMIAPINDGMLDSADVIVVGPGLGQHDASARWLAKVLARDLPTVIDADALNLIAATQDLQRQLPLRQAATILTPHPLEAARLLACDSHDIQQQRFKAVQKLAETYGCTVVLKGAGSLLADSGRLAVNESGSAALANAGQGDVLSGLSGALLAQGRTAWQAANLAVHSHGVASDRLMADRTHWVTLADEVASECGAVLAQLNRLSPG